jgi:hypothetical protein
VARSVPHTLVCETDPSNRASVLLGTWITSTALSEPSSSSKGALTSGTMVGRVREVIQWMTEERGFLPGSRPGKLFGSGMSYLLSATPKMT